ncbi:MAG: hypothetical protein EOR48_10580 [Mesorhizobium sp.]|nr:MAG: hypothetical protein EOR48_10580 [Mesorhizobium sp.]TIP39841.1 MAG: hypothetical protein E5X62_30090 [Mesorhizobium sp.]
MVDVGAAPHLPAGIFSPLTGRRGWPQPWHPSCNARDWRNPLRGVFLPVTIRGEMPGSAMRGGANLNSGACRHFGFRATVR